jgi:HSP20 family protein
MSRAFFGPAFGAADPFGREALAPRAPRAAAALAAPLPHTLGAADIKITPENALEISVDVPGVPKSALTVEVDAEDRVLTIAGSRADKLADEHKENEAGEGGEGAPAPAARAVRVERAASFLRRFALPPTADLDAITSSLKDGVLHVVVPSAAEEAKPAVKKIEVEG